MIVGSGLIAKACAAGLKDAGSPDVWLYAAGVSNSGCRDASEFERERSRLLEALEAGKHAEAFVYFGTCSVYDPETSDSPYVRHKLEMEKLVAEHPRFLVARFPQLAGRTPNPHTLLNYLYARISRSEKFTVWTKATRNIIDVDDAVSIVSKLLEDRKLRNITVNIANPMNYGIRHIVASMEKAVGKPAHFLEEDKGEAYAIDVSTIQGITRELGLAFDDQYLFRVIQKYYGKEPA
jgi:nucleoside-diphosphate-sugar epimerase